jgi:cell division protein FtsL
MRVRVISLCVIVVGLLISFGLAKNLYTAYQNSKILSDSEKNLTELQHENSRLKVAVSEASDPSYVDTEARKKLGLVKPGEVEVIIPQDGRELVATQAVQPNRNDEALALKSTVRGPRAANWRLWWGFLFGG